MRLIFHLQGRLGNIFFILSAFYYSLSKNIQSNIVIPEYVKYYLDENKDIYKFYSYIKPYVIDKVDFDSIHMWDAETEIDNVNIIDLDDIILKYKNTNSIISFDYVFFQNCKYFLSNKNLMKNIFTINNDKVQSYVNKIVNNDVLISVRRGDYFDANFYVLTKSYYIDMYNTYFKGKNIYITCDDIEWCRNNLLLNDFNECTNITYIDDLNPLEIVNIASAFNNFICANSTFSMMCDLFADSLNKVTIGVKNINKTIIRHNGFNPNIIIYDLNNKEFKKYIDNLSI